MRSTTRPLIFPACMSSRTPLMSSSFRSSTVQWTRPSPAISSASFRSWRVPTMEPRMVLRCRIMEKRSTENSPGGRAMPTQVPTGRSMSEQGPFYQPVRGFLEAVGWLVAGLDPPTHPRGVRRGGKFESKNSGKEFYTFLNNVHPQSKQKILAFPSWPLLKSFALPAFAQGFALPPQLVQISWCRI
eukprot:EG_transcript_16426